MSDRTGPPAGAAEVVEGPVKGAEADVSRTEGAHQR